jgi:hypothetical protein
MSHRLVLVHGRAQEGKDSIALKAEWIASFREGLAKSSLTLPIAEQDIRFPYYGDTLDDLVRGSAQPADVIVRGDAAGDAEREFIRSVLEEARVAAGITEEQLRQVGGQEVVARGPLNWEWSLAIVRAIDRFVPGGSGAGIAIATNDVYQYLRNAGVRDTIEQGVRAALVPGVATVVVGHSLGAVVSYNLLRRDGAAMGWVVPLYVTLGSPLGVSAIRKSLRPIQHPQCVTRWYNALDVRDIVALYPLDANSFDVDPAIENMTSVRNETPNRHGISGYLSDKDVARRVHDALLA